MNSTEAFELLEKIAGISGSSKNILLHEELQPYLWHAYNPFRRYYLTKCAVGEGTNSFDMVTWLLLEKLADREISGYLAQQLINDHTREMTKQSSILFNRILKKDLRIGMGIKTINKVFPNLIPVHDVMLAKLFNRDKVKFPCYGSPKIDGVRADYIGGKFYSRGGHEYTGLSHIAEELDPCKDVITGELIIPDMTFQESSGLIRSDKETPAAQFHMIDLPDTNVSFNSRLAGMKFIAGANPYALAVPHKPLESFDSVMNYYTQCRQLGYEGAVIKPIDYRYRGTRSWDWMKMKQVLTVDLRVIDLFEGKGKYVDQLGGVIVKYGKHNVQVGGGFSDYQRKEFWEAPWDINDKIIEVLYMEETDDGSLRHPRFVQIREDKDVSDRCS